MSRKLYSEEFKSEAVKFAIKRKGSLASTARELGISKSALYNWMNSKNISEDEMDRVATNKELVAEIKKLKQELAKSKQVEEILKKAAAYFMKEAQ